MLNHLDIIYSIGHNEQKHLRLDENDGRKKIVLLMIAEFGLNGVYVV
jgi:hypothetical protein